MTATHLHGVAVEGLSVPEFAATRPNLHLVHGGHGRAGLVAIDGGKAVPRADDANGG